MMPADEDGPQPSIIPSTFPDPRSEEASEAAPLLAEDRSPGGHGASELGGDVRADARAIVCESSGTQSNALLAVGSCLAWAATSNGLIVVNKIIMSTDQFRYPMALSSLGMLASTVCSYACCKAFGLATHEVTWRMHVFRIMPVGLFMAIMFYFGNLCYLYISLSFIQMLKTGSPIITMAALALAGLEWPSAQLVCAVLFIALGTAVASMGEHHFSWQGFVFMLISQVADAVRLVMTQVLLTSLRFHPMEGLLHLSPACTLCLWVGMVFLELPAMLAANALALVRAKPSLYLASAFMGFLVNLSSFMVIKHTGSLTLKILGAVSNAVLVFSSCALFGDELSVLEVCGYTVSLSGFVAYNVFKLGALSAAPDDDLRWKLQREQGWARRRLYSVASSLVWGQPPSPLRRLERVGSSESELETTSLLRRGCSSPGASAAERGVGLREPRGTDEGLGAHSSIGADDEDSWARRDAAAWGKQGQGLPAHPADGKLALAVEGDGLDATRLGAHDAGPAHPASGMSELLSVSGSSNHAAGTRGRNRSSSTSSAENSLR